MGAGKNPLKMAPWSKTLVLIKSRVEKYRPWFKHNKITITKNPDKIFQDYPKPRILLNLALDIL